MEAINIKQIRQQKESRSYGDYFSGKKEATSYITRQITGLSHDICDVVLADVLNSVLSSKEVKRHGRKK